MTDQGGGHNMGADLTPPAVVVIPYRADQDGHRAAARAHVRGWWARHHPMMPVVEGSCPADGPWCKAQAVADALRRLPELPQPTTVLVISDADVICPDVGMAVAAIQAAQRGEGGDYGWAVPHGRVMRLTEVATGQVYAHDRLPEQPGPAELAEHAGQGVAGGGIVVLPAALYEQVPLDARFLGWAPEDVAWAHALQVCAGKPWRGWCHLYHLWHPRAERGVNGRGSAASEALVARYQRARTPGAIAAILGEQGARAC